MFQVYARDGSNGRLIDTVAVSEFTWERLLSAGGSGSVTLPITDEYTLLDLRAITDHWNVIYEIEYEGVPQFLGYVTNRTYDRATGMLTLTVSDVWALLARRGAWDHGAPNVEKWSTTKNTNLAQHGADAIIRGRDTGPTIPRRDLPMTIPGQSGNGPDVKKTFFGYHLQMVGEVLSDLMDEGLDIYFKPNRPTNADGDWKYFAGVGWTSGMVHEYFVNADLGSVAGFSEVSDGARITNNARRVGEGSEQDMLVRSQRDLESPYILLDRVTPAKQTKDVASLSRQASADLSLYSRPTVQWDLVLPIADGVDVGDVLRLHFYGDPWITDGWHERRVVKVSGDMGEFVTVSCQPTGGA